MPILLDPAMRGKKERLHPFQLRPDEKRSFAAWRAIMAANFLADVSLPEEETNLIAIVERGVEAIVGG
jgi:hypothetical protein